MSTTPEDVTPSVMGWEQDAPDHWSRRLDDGRYLAAWPKKSRWVWEVLSADGEARILRTGQADSLVDAQLSAETAKVGLP